MLILEDLATLTFTGNKIVERKQNNDNIKMINTIYYVYA